MSTFGFRLRFLSHGPRLAVPETSYTFEMPDGLELTLKSGRDSRRAIREGGDLAIWGSGLGSETEARRVGTRVKHAIRASMAGLRMGFELGKGRATTGTSEVLKAALRDATGAQLLDNVHGLMVFEESSPVRVINVSGSATVSTAPGKVVAEWSRLYQRDLPALSDSEELAFELYSEVHRQPFPRAKFLGLATIVEVLAAPATRSTEAIALLAELGKQVESSGLANAEIRSLAGSIRQLKRESIAAACRRYVEGALGRAEAKEFQDFYKIRSKLTHDGSVGDEVDINEEVYALDALVARLLESVLGD